MEEEINKRGSIMYAKIRILGDIVVKTGMHIGGSSAFAAIGAVDSPVVKDVRSNLPMIPGSSLKGKMRSLLARELNDRIVEHNQDHERIARLFGASEKNLIRRSRILFSDMVLANEMELRQAGLQSMTEVKFENTISRATAVANPRQIERAVRGSIFEMELIYEMEKGEELLEDMETLAEGMRLLQYDYLGGSGTRGYGKIEFQNLDVETVVGELDENLLEQCGEILRKAIQK
jgi:CRISPR-associated protein Csm3